MKASEHCTKALYQPGFVWDLGTSYFSLHTNSLNNFTEINTTSNFLYTTTAMPFLVGFSFTKWVTLTISILFYCNANISKLKFHTRTVYMHNYKSKTWKFKHKVIIIKLIEFKGKKKKNIKRELMIIIDCMWCEQSLNVKQN